MNVDMSKEGRAFLRLNAEEHGDVALVSILDQYEALLPFDLLAPVGPASAEWCVHVQGMDDVLPAASRVDAMRRANAVNQFTLAHLQGAIERDGEVSPFWPHTWAVPTTYSNLGITLPAVETTDVAAAWKDWVS